MPIDVGLSIVDVRLSVYLFVECLFAWSAVKIKIMCVGIRIYFGAATHFQSKIQVFCEQINSFWEPWSEDRINGGHCDQGHNIWLTKILFNKLLDKLNQQLYRLYEVSITTTGNTTSKTINEDE